MNCRSRVWIRLGLLITYSKLNLWKYDYLCKISHFCCLFDLNMSNSLCYLPQSRNVLLNKKLFQGVVSHLNVISVWFCMIRQHKVHANLARFRDPCESWSNMAASCCGVKKQKLNNSMPSSICCNGSSVHPNGYKNGYSVACVDMCIFCFDVLHSHLHCYEPPKTPSFTNEAL